MLRPLSRTVGVALLGLVASGCRSTSPQPRLERPAPALARSKPEATPAPGPERWPRPLPLSDEGAGAWPRSDAWPAAGAVTVTGRGPGRAPGEACDVTFEPGPLGEVLATISRQADVNLVPEPGIDLEVQVEWGLRDIPWRDALIVLCDRYQLEDRRIGERTLYVTRPPRVTIQ